MQYLKYMVMEQKKEVICRLVCLKKGGKPLDLYKWFKPIMLWMANILVSAKSKRSGEHTFSQVVMWEISGWKKITWIQKEDNNLKDVFGLWFKLDVFRLFWFLHVFCITLVGTLHTLALTYTVYISFYLFHYIIFFSVWFTSQSLLRLESFVLICFMTTIFF